MGSLNQSYFGCRHKTNSKTQTKKLLPNRRKPTQATQDGQDSPLRRVRRHCSSIWQKHQRIFSKLDLPGPRNHRQHQGSYLATVLGDYARDNFLLRISSKSRKKKKNETFKSSKRLGS